MPATKNTINNIAAIRRRWNKLRNDEHGVDFARAKLLHGVYLHFDRDIDALADFIVGVLEEYPGKRTAMFVRYAVAFDQVSDPDIWKCIGGNSAVLLARVDGRRRASVLTRVDKTIESTGLTSIGRGTFRSILREILGEKYDTVLTEPRSAAVGAGARAQLRALRAYVLKLLKRDPKLKRGMGAEVKHALGIDRV